MPNILYVDNHLLVLNKPAGMLTQPNDTDAHSLESFGKEWLKREFHKPGAVFLGAVHRLDRPVSGIVLFARTSKALSRLNASMRAHEFQKDYIAVVEGVLEKPEGILEHYLVHDDYCARTVSAKEPGAKRCELHYQVLKIQQGKTVVRITLVTGRYHQIRAQFAAEGHPVLGDQKYGSTHSSDHLLLHHTLLVFPHPVTHETLRFEVPPPW